MVDKKNAEKIIAPRQSYGICFGVCATFCILSAIASFGVINYLQFEELWKLKLRVEQLEGYCNEQKWSRQAHEHVQVEQIRDKRDVAGGSLTGLITSLVQQEVGVLQQYCGNASKICLPGQKGDIGTKGDKGSTGMAGPPGVKGQQGQYGVPGIPGVKGEIGEKGDVGVKGEKGDTGMIGIPGVKGERGNYGVPGIPGVKGEPGSSGVAGMKGQKGEEGRPLPFNQQCCSSLAKPQYLGNSTETVKAYVGQSVILPCQTSGYPPPSVTFTPTVDPTGKNRYSISAQGLQIQGVQLGDSGQYKCEVDNILGTTQKIVNLLVTDPVVITTNPNTININEYDRLTITCDISGYPTPTITWQHVRPDGKVEPVSAQPQGQSSVVAIFPAHPIDAGTYTCTGKNQYETDSATTTVTVTGKPQIVDPPQSLAALDGSTVTLHCRTVANPPGNVSWTYPLTGNKPPLNAYVNPDNSMTLTRVDTFNAGTYTCTATNALGSSTASASLSIEQGLDVNVSPHVFPLTGSEQILDFQCQATGTPTPTIQWSKDGSSLTGSTKYVLTSGGTLIVTDVDINTDTGVYECKGTNNNGNTTDKTVVYRDNGQLTCVTAFNQSNCNLGQLCGAKCPAHCPNQGQILYGYEAYTGASPICLAAQHTGTLPNKDNLVLWKHQNKPTVFQAISKNGLQSSSHPLTSDSYRVIQPTDTTNKLTTLIG